MKKGRGLKIGIIGLGAMGKHHARICSILSCAKLFAVADIDQEEASQIGKLFKATVFYDYKEMLPAIDAVIIATPTQTHFQIAQECLKAGKNILIEKPFTKTSHEAQKLIDLAQSKSLILAVGLIERYNPAFQELCKLLRKEKIIGIHFTRLSPFPERITDANVIQDMMVAQRVRDEILMGVY